MTSSDDVIAGAFAELWNDVDQGETFPAKRPLLAHYTSISTLESIVANDELWFSNPLFMNDLQELRFGINEGVNAFARHEGIRSACGDDERYRVLADSFNHYFDEFGNRHALDTYVFCLSEHNGADSDGLLSMWRGYGGNGNGAAIVFDTAKLEHKPGLVPLIISKVSYHSEDVRREWIEIKLDEFSRLLAKQGIATDKLYLAAYYLFERIKMFALFTKHHGFHEEKEWRVVYLRERDVEKRLDGMLHYAVGPRGIEPKLKFKVLPVDTMTSTDLSLEKIVSQIILGPATSNRLAIESVRRMLQTRGKHQLADRVTASTTPFRCQ